MNWREGDASIDSEIEYTYFGEIIMRNVLTIRPADLLVVVFRHPPAMKQWVYQMTAMS